MSYDPNDPNNPKDTIVIGEITDLLQGEGDPGFSRSGPLLDAGTFRTDYLFGVPMKAALTGDIITVEMLKRFIERAVSDFETSVRIPVRPVRITEKFDYERADDLAFGTRQLKRWPVLQIEKLEALWPGRVPGQGAVYPTDWVELEGDNGLIRIVPRSASSSPTNVNFVSSGGYAGTPIGNFKNWPGLWHLQYTAGFKQDHIPHAVNHLIGIMAAIGLLSQLGPAIFPYSSQSIGIDGMSQGTSSGGPQWLALRMQELIAERERLILSLRSHYGTDIQLAAF